MESLINMLEESQRMAWDVGDHNLAVFRTSEPISKSQFSGESNTQQGKGGELQSGKPKNWKKPKDMPRRPLSAYNLFFKSERQRIVSSVISDKQRTGNSLGVGFVGLVRNVASKWNILESSDKSVFEEQAKIEKIRYFKEVSVWRSKRAEKSTVESVETIEAPTKSSSTAMRTISLSTCEASDVTGPHLQQTIMDLLLRGPQQLSKTNALPNLNPIPLLTFPPSRSIIFLDEEATYDFHQVCRPSTVEPVYEDIFPSSHNECVPASSWETLASHKYSEDIFPSTHDKDVSSSGWETFEPNLCSESLFPHETVQDARDDLTIFMDTMEKDYV